MLHAHKDVTDGLGINEIVKEFVSTSDDRIGSLVLLLHILF